MLVEDLEPDESNTNQTKRDLQLSEINQRKPLKTNQPLVKLVRYDPEDPTNIEGYFDNSNHILAKLKRWSITERNIVAYHYSYYSSVQRSSGGKRNEHGEYLPIQVSERVYSFE